MFAMFRNVNRYLRLRGQKNGEQRTEKTCFDIEKPRKSNLVAIGSE